MTPQDIAAARLEAELNADSPEEIQAIRDLSDEDIAALVGETLDEEGAGAPDDTVLEPEPGPVAPDVTAHVEPLLPAPDEGTHQHIHVHLHGPAMPGMPGIPQAPYHVTQPDPTSVPASARPRPYARHPDLADPDIRASTIGYLASLGHSPLEIRAILEDTAPGIDGLVNEGKEVDEEPIRFAEGAEGDGLSPTDTVATHSHAEDMAELFTRLEEAGVDVPEDEVHALDEELQGTGWHVQPGGDGVWEVLHADDLEGAADEGPEQYIRTGGPWRYEAKRAPVGGVHEMLGRLEQKATQQELMEYLVKIGLDAQSAVAAIEDAHSLLLGLYGGQ